MMQVAAVFPPLLSVNSFNPSSAAQIPTKKLCISPWRLLMNEGFFLILWWRGYDENTIYIPVYK